MKSSSTGPNGLTLRFQKSFFSFFGHNFVQMLNNLKDNIPKNFRDSVIKFIIKNDNKEKSINDYMSICITNYELKQPFLVLHSKLDT